MFRKSVIGAGVLALFGTAAYAASVEVDFDKGVDTKAILEAIRSADYKTEGLPSAEAMEASRKPAKPSKEWTIMVFINGKNNLEQYGLKDVNEMEMVGSGDKVNVVVELARIKGYSSADGNWTGSRRYLIQKDTETSKITSPIVQTIPTVDMGDWNHLVDFGNWVKTNYPAKKYMLIVWNHGSGWNKSVAGPSKGISYDDETGKHITTQQLGQALAKIGGVDVYGSDACLMQMAEVNYQIKDNAKVIVQSEETEPGDGYTYNDFLNKVMAKQNATPAEIGVMAADAYTDHYVQIGQGATQSSVSGPALAGLAPMVKEWVSLAMASKDTAAIKAAKDCQAYYYSDNKDMYDFLSIVADKTSDAALKAKSQEIMKYLEANVVLHNRWTGSSYSKSHGLAVYVPDSFDSTYNGLAWSADTGWNTFAQWAASIQ